MASDKSNRSLQVSEDSLCSDHAGGITSSPGIALACITDNGPDLISIGDLAHLLATHTDENEMVWFVRLKAAGNSNELHVRHFPDGKVVGTEGSLRDQAGGRHFMAADVATWLSQHYPSSWANLLTEGSRAPNVPDMAEPLSQAQNIDQDRAISVNTRPLQNKSGRARDALWPIIDIAKGKVLQPNNIASVYAALVEIAKSKDRPVPLLGATEEGIQYLTHKDEVAYLTKEALNKRINPSARGKSKRTS